MVKIIFTKLRFWVEQVPLADFEDNHKVKRK